MLKLLQLLDAHPAGMGSHLPNFRRFGPTPKSLKLSAVSAHLQMTNQAVANYLSWLGHSPSKCQIDPALNIDS